MKKIIVLGGGADQADLMKVLKRRGYYIILIDYLDNPVAKSEADEFIQESTLDKEKVLEIAKKVNPENLITACTDQALLTVAYVAAEMGYPTQFTYQQALNITNKSYMKQIMSDSGIPTAKFIYVDEAISDIQGLTYPLIVKPADSNGSFGVRKAITHQDLQNYLQDALKISRSGKAIVEEFKSGIEVSVDCFVEMSQYAKVLLITQLNKIPGYDSGFPIFQSIVPAPIGDVAAKRIKDIANQIAKTFDLVNTPLLIQFIVDKDEVSVIEFSARIGGGAKHKLIEAITGFDIMSAYVDAFLGKIPDVKFYEPKFYYSRNHIYTAGENTFAKVSGFEELLDQAVIEDFILNKSPGMAISNNMASRDRIGSFLIKAETMEVLFQKISIAANRLKVFNSDNIDVMRRDMFDPKLKQNE